MTLIRSVPMWPFLIPMYALFAGQGIAATFVGVPSVDRIAGAYGTFWPVALALFSVTAIVGVVLSETIRRRTVELIGSLGVISLFGGYATALWVFSADDGGIRLPFAIGMTAYTALSVYRGAILIRLIAADRHIREAK